MSIFWTQSNRVNPVRASQTGPVNRYSRSKLFCPGQTRTMSLGHGLGRTCLIRSMGHGLGQPSSFGPHRLPSMAQISSCHELAQQAHYTCPLQCSLIELHLASKVGQPSIYFLIYKGRSIFHFKRNYYGTQNKFLWAQFTYKSCLKKKKPHLGARMQSHRQLRLVGRAGHGPS